MPHYAADPSGFAKGWHPPVSPAPKPEKSWALLETGNPPQTRVERVREGEGGVEEIRREGVVLREANRRFLVPLAYLAPKPSRL